LKREEAVERGPNRACSSHRFTRGSFPRICATASRDTSNGRGGRPLLGTLRRVAGTGSYAGSNLSATQEHSTMLRAANQSRIAPRRTALLGLWSRRPREPVAHPSICRQNAPTACILVRRGPQTVLKFKRSRPLSARRDNSCAYFFITLPRTPSHCASQKRHGKRRRA